MGRNGSEALTVFGSSNFPLGPQPEHPVYDLEALKRTADAQGQKFEADMWKTPEEMGSRHRAQAHPPHPLGTFGSRPIKNFDPYRDD